MNKEQYNNPERTNIRKTISIVIMFGSILGLFFIGFYFNLFSAKIDFIQNPSTFLFFGFMLSGLFGIFYLFKPTKIAIKQTIKLTIFFCIVYLAGKLVRGEL